MLTDKRSKSSLHMNQNESAGCFWLNRSVSWLVLGFILQIILKEK